MSIKLSLCSFRAGPEIIDIIPTRARALAWVCVFPPPPHLSRARGRADLARASAIHGSESWTRSLMHQDQLTKRLDGLYTCAARRQLRFALSLNVL